MKAYCWLAFLLAGCAAAVPAPARPTAPEHAAAELTRAVPTGAARPTSNRDTILPQFGLRLHDLNEEWSFAHGSAFLTHVPTGARLGFINSNLPPLPSAIMQRRVEYQTFPDAVLGPLHRSDDDGIVVFTVTRKDLKKPEYVYIVFVTRQGEPGPSLGLVATWQKASSRDVADAVAQFLRQIRFVPIDQPYEEYLD